MSDTDNQRLVDAEARRQRILAKGRERLARVTYGGELAVLKASCQATC